MIGWDYFNKELHYKYVQLLLKDLTPVEADYLNFLRDGVDQQIGIYLDYIENHYDELEKLETREEWEKYYRKNEIWELLLTLFGNISFDNFRRISDFYYRGGSLAYSHMGVNPTPNLSDKKALENLNKYTGSVVDSINTEFSNGVKDCIGEHIQDNTLDSVKEDILGLRYKPLKSPFSVDTRSIFTTKTEYARGVNTGLLQGYSNYGVDQYEWVTSGLPNVCKTCKSYEENNPYTLNEIINMLPVHVNCVCTVKAKLPKELYLQKKPVIVDLTPKK